MFGPRKRPDEERKSLSEIGQSNLEARKRFAKLSTGAKIRQGVCALLFALVSLSIAYLLKYQDTHGAQRVVGPIGAQFLVAIFSASCIIFAIQRFVSAAPDHVGQKLGFKKLGRILDQGGRPRDLLHILIVFIVLAAAFATVGYINGWF